MIYRLLKAFFAVAIIMLMSHLGSAQQQRPAMMQQPAAGQLPTIVQQRPDGQREMQKQRPFGLEPPEDAIFIYNFGDKTLRFRSYDGVNWIPHTLNSGEKEVIVCPKCDRTIYVALNDGHEDKTFATQKGRRYFLRWLEKEVRWDLEGAPLVPSAPSPKQE